jgi:chromosome segregation protein
LKLTKLELNGFKSFARKTEIHIENGITAIIGPNGSGKSNIADAVRWVLGEQSAKALRGTKMEDVIFNGTQSRKPQAFCEVTLTFDNSDGELPTEFAEVSVTRRVYRSGESEYLLNRGACRLKDIQALLRDTGVGKEGYSIISQGKVEEILSNRSDERRAAFEEAAGIMKYRVRKEEAERKLDNTKKNLVRLDDILKELERQVGPLEEQSAAAREYLKLRDELKEIEINVFLYQYDKLTERLAGLTGTLEQLDEQLVSSGAVFDQLGADCMAEEEKERALSTAIGDLQNRLLAMSSGAETHSGEAKVLQERMAGLERERERLQAENGQISQKHAELSAQIQSFAEDAEDGRKAYEQSAALLMQTESQLNALQAQIDEKEADTERRKNSMIEALNRLSDSKSRISGLEAIKTTLLARVDAVLAEQAGIREEGEKLAGEYGALQGRYLELQAEYAQKNAAREAAVQRVNELAGALRAGQEDLRGMEQRMQAASSRIKVLEEMKKAHEGYYASVRNILRDAERDMGLKQCIEGVVAELVRVPQQYEVAIEMALGSALQNIVTPTEQAAKQVIDRLRQKEYGRATLLPVSMMRPRLLGDKEREQCRVEGFLGIASELVAYDARYQGIFENLLGRTVIVRDLDAGIAINRQAHGAFRIATIKGDIINPGGSMTGGSTQKREFSLIGREREIDELNKNLAALQAGIALRQKECGELEIALAQANHAAEQAAGAQHAQDVELAAQREKTEALRQYVEDNEQGLARGELECSQIRDNIENIDEQCREAAQDQTKLEQGSEVTQEDIRALQAEIHALHARHNSVNEEMTRQKVALMAQEKEAQSAEHERGRMRKEADALLKQADANKETVERGEAQLNEMRAQFGALGQNIDAERKDIDVLTGQLHALEEERIQRLHALDEARERKDTLNIEIGDLRERRHRAELNQSRAQLELANMQDRIWNDYEITYENAQPLRRDIAVMASHARIDELKQAIRELGDVNVSSIEDYKNVKERFETLDAQCRDLTQAEADLQVLIADLAATMEDEFKKQFFLIQQNFFTVFAELFGGGRAELVLSDPNDILNCDIDIIAQPPGKKQQLLSLLSGGERTLTAIALLFAILKLKPTAFCILDEIEAALDEANVTNFAEYVRNYSQNTQFILITHRKGSMEVCDSLYGVAMEEKGISKIVSARFNEIA